VFQLGTALQTHVAQAKVAQAKSLNRWLGWLTGQSANHASSFGYTASVWRRAAQQVFGAIGPAQTLRLSPPLAAREAAIVLAQTRPQLAYFNLHGLPDSPHWYGQRDPEFIADYAPFPVALSPADIGSHTRVVFTAACYGIHSFACDVNTSLALRFMQSGALALVGSTTVAYGGLDQPLIGVDLLAQLFWQNIVAGRSSGQALRQAKINFAQQTQARQGYLDGEDLKTLSSFILLGDPLLVPLPTARLTFSPDYQTVSHAPVVCAKSLQNTLADISEDQVHQVKQFVAHAMPEMSQAAVQHSAFTAQRSACKVLSLSKTLPYGDHIGVQLVRVTLDDAGKIIKLAMSK
jgi:hypothetical protein